MLVVTVSAAGNVRPRNPMLGASRPPGSPAIVATGIVFVVAIISGAALAALARGDASERYVVRQVFTERFQGAAGETESVAETWTLVGPDDRAEDFIGLYFNSAGNLTQAQRRTPKGEFVFWTDYQGERTNLL
jgi:hypothetical protein